MRKTIQAGKVLRQFLAHPGEPQYGYGLMVATGLASGTLYPLLAKFCEHGWLDRSAQDTPLAKGPHPRRIYALTAEGERAAREFVAALDAQYGTNR